MNTKALTRIITLVNAAHEDVKEFIDHPNNFDRVEYFESVEEALREALELLDPKELIT